MKFQKTSLALLLGATLLAGCNSSETQTTLESTNNNIQEIKIATYNLSFDRATYQDLVDELALTFNQQQAYVTALLNGEAITDEFRARAWKVVQIRNVAAIIQKNRPNVLMLAEFNNNGSGDDLAALKGFQDNYLSIPQSVDGAGGEANLEPIEYPFAETYATNTGRINEFGFDLDNNGTSDTLPGDAWGFGFYHGQYAFALMSQYEIDTANTRTFQNFKWKALDGAAIPTITLCDDPSDIPTGMACGDNWYTDVEWNEVLLSSKNHVDAPIIIPTENGEEVIHLLMSHPTPPAFDTGKNIAQNSDEVRFWHQYIDSSKHNTTFTDDNNQQGGLKEGSHFVIMGDLNLDPADGDGISATMQALHADPLMNQDVLNGDLYPISNGASEHAADTSKVHPLPNRITSTFGLGVDYAMPSATLNVVDSGVYWSASYEEGRKLFNDERIGRFGNGKDVSSDHRMVWFKAQL